MNTDNTQDAAEPSPASDGSVANHSGFPNSWIPVTERLPDRGSTVWVYDGADVAMGEFSCQDGFVSSRLDVRLLGITHWMKIDKPAEPSLESAGSQPVAYEVWWDGAARQPYFVSADEKPSGNWTPAPRCVPLYRSPPVSSSDTFSDARNSGESGKPTLTDAEREAIRRAVLMLDGVEDLLADAGALDAEAVATLRGLLERTK